MIEQTTYEYKDYVFQTKDEYLAAYLDGKKITYLTQDRDIDYPLAVKTVKQIKREGITFETIVGEEFLDEIQECITTYRRHRKKMTIRVCCYVVIFACVSFFAIDGFLEFCSRKNMSMIQQSVNSLRKNYEVEMKIMKGAEQFLCDVSKSMTGNKIEIKEESLPQVTRTVLPQYQQLYKNNVNFNGWLKIDGTNVDYPVMWGPDNKYYLSHDMEHKFDKNGMLIMDTCCSEQYKSPQLIIYGHNVQSGRMFGELLNYKDQAYYKYHPSITYDSLFESNKYEIVAVVVASMEQKDDQEAFYHFTHFIDESEYDTYITEMKNQSLYETECKPEYGDELIALVTCEYTKSDGRLIVLAANTENESKQDR